MNDAIQLLEDMKYIDKTLERYKVEYALNKDDEYRQLINDNRSVLIKKKKTVMRCMKKMKTSSQRIIQLRYFDGLTIEDVASQINYTPRRTYNKIDEALREFTKHFIELHTGVDVK